MDIVFADKGLQALCENWKKQRKRFGANGAKKLQGRLADLVAAANVTELVAGHPHPLKGDRAGQFSLRLHGACRLVFEPTAIPPPSLEDGAISWRDVTSVRIVFIGDYHD